MRISGIVAIALATALLPASWAAADTKAITLQESLDKVVDVKIEEAPIKDVFDKISQQIGVKIVVPAETLDLLPYGEKTKMRIQLANVTLRKALGQLLAQHALTWTIDNANNEVRIVPKEALFRLGQRASLDELLVLGSLYAHQDGNNLPNHLQPTATGGPILAQLQKITKRKTLKFNFPPMVEKQDVLDKAEKVLPAVPSEYLDAVCQNAGLTWFVMGDEIFFKDLQTQVERQLRKRVTLNYQKAELSKVLVELAQKARVSLQMDPGVLNYLPVETRENFNLAMSDATIKQALEVIQGVTGLKFITTPDGIKVTASPELKAGSVAASQPAPQQRRRVGLVRMDLKLPSGAPMEVWMSVDDLPQDVQDAIVAARNKYVEDVRKDLPKSTTQPAAPGKPAPKPVSMPVPEE